MNEPAAPYLQEGLRVAALNRQLSERVQSMQEGQKEVLDASIASSLALLSELGIPAPHAAQSLPLDGHLGKPAAPRSWESLLHDASNGSETIDFADLLTAEEVRLVEAKHSEIGSELDWSGSLTKFDVALATVAGSIAGLLDVVLVGVPKTPGFLGSQPNEGGWLSNLVKEKFNGAFPPERIKELEELYKTPYDPSVNTKLNIPIDGLSPRSHRYQSLGHDPILGFIFGIRDILGGTFTAISKTGQLITQKNGTPFMPDEAFFFRIIQALKLHVGHLASDVATPAGLPAPLMPLLSFLQFGKIGGKEYTIAQLSSLMYRAGYDARHFVATSIPVLVSEIIVRLGHVVQALHLGKPIAEAIPIASNLSVRRKLIIAHGVATLVNAGKVYVTANPLAVSWAQVMALTRYLVPELRYLVFGKDVEKMKLVEDAIHQGYVDIYSQTSRIGTAPIAEKIVI